VGIATTVVASTVVVVVVVVSGAATAEAAAVGEANSQPPLGKDEENKSAFLIK